MENKRLPNIVVIAILTTFTVICWAGFDIYRSLARKPETTIEPQVLEPLSPGLDETMIEEVVNKTYFTEEQIGDTEIKPATLIPPGPKTTPTPTQSPTTKTIEESAND